MSVSLAANPFSLGIVRELGRMLNEARAAQDTERACDLEATRGYVYNVMRLFQIMNASGSFKWATRGLVECEERDGSDKFLQLDGPYTNVNDARFDELEKILVWFRAWKNERQCASEEGKPTAALISEETWFALEAASLSFCAMIKGHLAEFGGRIVARKLGSDCVENIFSMQRLLRGHSTKVDASSYAYSCHRIYAMRQTSENA